ncbi:replication initiator protein RepSA [Actinocorallia aurea]
MNPAELITPTVSRTLADRATRADYGRWATQVKHTGGCAQPVHLRGRVTHLDAATGEVLRHYSTSTEPDGVLRVACKTRRASRCPACAEVYRADTYQLVRAGLVGGKGVPDTVTGHPAAFVTLTAPSFGPVHTTRKTKAGRTLPCHPRRNGGTCPHGSALGCGEHHHPDDPRLGEPLCPDCYDYTGHVLFNALAPELWRRFTLAVRRRLAKTAGLTLAELKTSAVVSFAKIAEYQRRGLVHFHAVIRLDGPDGPTSAPPSWATFDALADAVQHAAGAVRASSPAADSLATRAFAWGLQLDIRPINASGELTDQAVAGYIAKYATKAAECVGTIDRRIPPGTDLDALDLRPHPRRLIAECLRLGALPGLEELRLAEWAHMLGFRGHFSTKSRRYSTTLGALREARAEHQRQQTEEVTTGRLPLFAEDTVLVVRDWRMVGRGHTPGELLLSAALCGQTLPAFYLIGRNTT